MYYTPHSSSQLAKNFFMLRTAPILGGTGGFACHGRFGCGSAAMYYTPLNSSQLAMILWGSQSWLQPPF
jgi:hypothetical protein